MNRDDLDHELTRLQEASQRIATNLVELEIDSSRQLLEASSLTGIPAARWAAADELTALLEGPSIELARSPVPLADRDLLGSSEITCRRTAGELIARMSTAFDEAKTVVSEFAAAWNALTPRLTGARAVLEQTRALALALAHEALYTAPTDLARVAQLVRRYQEILSGAGRAREALR